MNKAAGRFLIGIAVVFSVAFLAIASHRKLTDLENVLFQIFSLGIGLIGAYVLGEASSKEKAMEIVRPHARSAFRRVLSLYESLSRLLQTMGRSKQLLDGNPSAIAAIEMFESLVLEQLCTSGHSIEDWEDLVPEEIAELKARASKQQSPEVQQ
jgi:hypothetical protein